MTHMKALNGRRGDLAEKGGEGGADKEPQLEKRRGGIYQTGLTDEGGPMHLERVDSVIGIGGPRKKFEKERRHPSWTTKAAIRVPKKKKLSHVLKTVR